MFADSSDEFPGLTTSNGFSEIISLCIKGKEMLRIAGDIWISYKILNEYFPDTCVDKYFATFASFLLFDSETFFDSSPIIHEMTDLQTQEIRNP